VFCCSKFECCLSAGACAVTVATVVAAGSRTAGSDSARGHITIPSAALGIGEADHVDDQHQRDESEHDGLLEHDCFPIEEEGSKLIGEATQ